MASDAYGPGTPAVRSDRDPLKRYTKCPPEHFSRWRSRWYLLALRLICRPILMVTYRPRVFGRKRVPKSGPFIIVCNHIDAFDPIIVAHAVDYPVAFVAKKELFQIPLLRDVIRFMGSFSLDRSHPTSSSLKTVFNVLRSEGRWALCMFPEGTRSRTGKLLPLKKGVGSLAVKTGLPVLPIGIHKSAAGRFIVTVGEPIMDVSDPEVVHANVQRSLIRLVDPGWDRTRE